MAVSFCAGQTLFDPASMVGLRMGADEGLEAAITLGDLARRVAAMEAKLGIENAGTPTKVLSASGRKILFLLASHGSGSKQERVHVDMLISFGYLQEKDGRLRITPEGLNQLTYGAQVALRRPDNYLELSSEEQWRIDKGLGILDWDGTC